MTTRALLLTRVVVSVWLLLIATGVAYAVHEWRGAG
jgi:hypothetical protein